jgi:hypothetical protein
MLENRKRRILNQCQDSVLKNQKIQSSDLEESIKTPKINRYKHGSKYQLTRLVGSNNEYSNMQTAGESHLLHFL